MDYLKYRVEPGTRIRLGDLDPGDRSLFEGSKRDRLAHLETLGSQLEELQELVYAQGKHPILIVLQAPDTGGKDGTIRRVFETTNPQGVDVATFKVPSERERSHDYLWRCHLRCPERGQIMIFNRSHYEDVLIVRVHDLVPKEVWMRRYHHINEFERMLTDEGTTILKFFLHISKDEQKERLQARLENPHKNWKFKRADLNERKRWDEYQQAFEDMLSRTSTEYAPWHVVPANSKSYRDIVVSRILIHTLEELGMSYPPPAEDLDGIVID